MKKIIVGFDGTDQAKDALRLGATVARGVGSQLVRSLRVEAERLRFDRVYFGTGGPRFYERLGAVVHDVPRPGFWFMRFDL